MRLGNLHLEAFLIRDLSAKHLPLDARHVTASIPHLPISSFSQIKNKFASEFSDMSQSVIFSYPNNVNLTQHLL